MRKSISIIASAACAMLASLSVSAQPSDNGQRPERPKQPTVEEAAKCKSDCMKRELNLSDKQYKKVYSFYKSSIKEERELMEERRSEGFPGGGGFPGGAPPQGGGPGMGGGFPGGGPGMGGGFPGGAPPQGGGPEMGGGRPPMGGPGTSIDPEEFDKMYQKQEKKLQKILTEDQYTQWRAKHPKPQPPMPEVKMDSKKEN